MNFDRINEQLQKIKTTKKIEDIHTLVSFLVESFGITQCNPEELFMHASVQREVSRFMPAQGFRNQAAAYTIPHQSGIPLDIKLFWMKKTTKANLSWVMALTPNYEDNPETNANLNIGIDIVVSENCDSVFIVLSNNLKVRVLELNGSLSLTQREIFDNWVKIGKTINHESEHFKKEFHTLLWKSFDFEPINRKFYLQLVEQFDHLVGHLKKNIDEEPAKMFAVRLIGRTLFLWFLRKKEFVNPEFDYFTVSGDADQTQYYREKLEPLFFEVLNTEIKERSFADKITPFLNGGLFEPIDTDFYKDSKLTFPTGFFTQFFNVLNHYNFTVDEGTSEYEQVAVDPEMLGRVFENLLASLNDETGNQARKSKGAFYTPREIVDYMCEQSLVEYLKTKLPDTANRDRRIEELVTMDEASFREQDHNKRRDWKKDLGQGQVVQALDELKILDPAVGSGAFPMGMLNLLVKVYTRIDTAREKDLAQLKRDILSRSLYGVDIDQMAIQISRLRAWLSILVDMENLKKAEPLPNLDFKFVCANTLIPLDDSQNGLFDGDANLKENLIKLRDQYYAATRKIDKEKIRKEYLKLINTGSLFASQRELQLKDYNPFNPLNSSGFYDPTLMHGVEAFDVVIGNPPYVSTEKIKEPYKSKYKFIYSKTHAGRTDLYVYFYERGLELSRFQTGMLCYITSNKWIRSGYGEKLRGYFVKHNPLIIIDLGGDVFESATVDSNILVIQNCNNKKKTRSLILKNHKNSLYKEVVNNSIENSFDKEDPWFIGKNIDKTLLIKISQNGITLKEKGFKIYRGIVSGLKSVFEIDQNLYKNLVDTDSSYKKVLKEILHGREIYRFGIDKKNTFLIFASRGFEIEKYPLIKEYLSKYKNELENRSTINSHPWYELQQPQMGIFNEFEKERIVYPDISRVNSFSICDPGIYQDNTTYSIDSNSRYLLGVLNSKTVLFYYKSIANIMGENTMRYFTQYVEMIPIPNVDLEKKEFIEKIVNEIIYRKKTNKDTSDLESQVDELVMDLYGLNEEEKEIIRNS